MSKLRKTDGATYSRIDSQELLTAQVLISQSIFTGAQNRLWNLYCHSILAEGKPPEKECT